MLAYVRPVLALFNSTYASPHMTRELRDQSVAAPHLTRNKQSKGLQKRCFKRTTDSEYVWPAIPNLLVPGFSVRDTKSSS